MKSIQLILIWLMLSIGLVFFWAVRLDFLRWRHNPQAYQPRPIAAKSDSQIPNLTAKSFLVVEVDSGRVIGQKNPHFQLNPASITKVATAINALESYPLGEVMTVKQEYPIGKNMELQAGEKITVENLIYGLLVHSANDAAFVLAGQNDEEVDNFITRLNKFVRQFGLEDTHFVNFDGEDDQNHYSSAYDLAHLARFALNNKVFEQAVRKKEMVVTDVSGKIVHRLETTNELLDQVPEVKGIKTGWTPTAGECFLGLVEIDENEFITVILGSEDRFGETKLLIDWLKKVS